MSTWSGSTSSATGTTRSRAWAIGLPIAVIVAGIVVAAALVLMGPEAERHVAPPVARLVDIETLTPAPARVVVEAMGVVAAAREVELKSEVVGRVLEVSPEMVPGGVFREGEAILRIDPRDYELAVRERESDVVGAESELKLEFGQQLVAKREYELLGEVIAEQDRELVLRMPQLAAARQRVDAAKAAVEQARLALERTEIVAPFNAIVRVKSVDPGDVVGTSTVVAILTGTDSYWIEISVPVADLRWIHIPRKAGENGSTVTIRNDAAWGKGVVRHGRIIRLAGDLEEQGRMARVLVEIDDPMSLTPESRDAPVLLIGSYVRVEIEGRELEAVISLSRDLLRENETVWLVDQDDRLELRPVEIAYRGRDSVLITAGLNPGDRVIRTNLAAPVAGMPLRVSENVRTDSN